MDQKCKHCPSDLVQTRTYLQDCRSFYEMDEKCCNLNWGRNRLLEQLRRVGWNAWAQAGFVGEDIGRTRIIIKERPEGFS